MPKFTIGDIRKREEVGLKGNAYVIWAACLDCGRERWITFNKKRDEPSSKRCWPCSGRLIGLNHTREGSPRWKGGRVKTTDGYIAVYLYPDDFFYSMSSSNGYVLEHRLVVAKALGRCLHRWEIIHHKHAKYPAGTIEDKQDNRYPENLQLVSDDRHKQISILERRIAYLEQRVTLLEAENILLKEEVKI